MGIHINNLTLCLTRKCQLKCLHCMRGPAQNLTMDEQVIYDLFGQGIHVHFLLLTGGEPTLAPKLMKLIGDALHMTSSTVQYVGMTTNGISFTKAPQEAFDHIYRFTQSTDNDQNYIDVSRDKWHLMEKDDPIRENLQNHPLFAGPRSDLQEGQLLVTGNWDTTTGGYGESDAHVPNLEKFRSGACYDCPNSSGGFNIAVTAKGNVVTSENMSYTQEDDPNNILCRVEDLTETLEKIREKTSDRQEQVA